MKCTAQKSTATGRQRQMFDLVERENAIFEILQKLKGHNLQFVIVGGYAVSAYRHRFSMDADIVLRERDISGFEKILQENGFFKSVSKVLGIPYASFIRYENARKASVDLLVNGVAVRQTGAFFSYGILMENSEEREVIGTEKSVALMVPGREILIAMKLHSGRLADFRDVVALSYGINISRIKEFISLGNTDVVEDHLKRLSGILEDRNFTDSFKGVFMEKKPVDFSEAKNLCAILQKKP